jgi:hypothetical protein
MAPTKVFEVKLGDKVKSRHTAEVFTVTSLDPMGVTLTREPDGEKTPCGGSGEGDRRFLYEHYWVKL